eukprot:GHRQ01003864.1.p1 GENE.GHRQ01003864.1~~GHRQ01003864.1.p1  ORF type:complete len:539 (+),score=208.74 GHRQ01003864.1:165-1781(+)
MMLAAYGVSMHVNTVTPVTSHEVVSLQGSGKVMAEYIWLGSSGADLKSRTVVLDEQPVSPEDLPIAEIDGSSYGQAAEESCEIYLQPKKIFSDPFRGGNHILVLCDTYVPPLACQATADPWDDMAPHISNHRAACEEVMKQATQHQPVFTMQQEYTLISEGCSLSGGFLMGDTPGVPIRNSAGLSDKAAARLGREVNELHMHACLSAGLSYSGSHTSSTHQHGYKVGPCLGVDAADQLSLSRFLLQRIAQHSAAGIHYDSLGGLGSSSGNKCTVQFSTACSRDPVSGLSAIQQMMDRLHSSHVATFSGCGNAVADSASSGSWHSSSGFSEPTAPTGMARFTVGQGNRHAAIMVPTSTLLNKCGPILDRRPPAGSDPYLTTMLLVANACGLPLPQSTRKALQLAAALAAATGGPAAALPTSIPSSQQPSRSCGSFGSPSCGASAAPSCSLSGLSGSLASLAGSDDDSLAGSADSEAVLLSALDRLDGFVSCSMPIGVGGAGSCCMYGSDDEDVCSDASSPVLASSSLAGAAEAHKAMYL